MDIPLFAASLLERIKSINGRHSAPTSPSCILSTGKNWRCLCGWLAPLCSPELKNANRRFCLLLDPSCHAFKQAYVASRSSCSSVCVCFLLGFVARMKCSAIIGNLLSTSKWLGSVVGMSTIWSAEEGFSNGSTLFFGVVPFLGTGFFASVGQNRNWNYDARKLWCRM